MRTLTIDCHGTGLALALEEDGRPLGHARLEQVGGPEPRLYVGDGEPAFAEAADHGAAFTLLLERLPAGAGGVEGVTVRFGSSVARDALLDEVGAALARLSPLFKPSVKAPRIPVAISARHVHLTEAAVEQLFGPGRALTVKKPLSQPGYFAAEEQVTLIGPKNHLEHVRVLGPCRARCQVEVARTDEFFLGIEAPIRVSGDLDGTPGITLAGPAGTLVLDDGVICAQRHIHANPREAAALGLADRDVVEVALDTEGRDLVFGDVAVRISERVNLEMHLDTDEGNAAEIAAGETGVLAPTGTFARLTRRHVHFDGERG
jgi:acetate kinase